MTDQPPLTVRVVCREPSHNGRTTAIATFSADVDEDGRRGPVSLDPVVRRTPDGRHVQLPSLWHQQTPGPNRRPAFALMTLLDDQNGSKPTSGTTGLDGGHHFQCSLTCQRCGLDVTARVDNLMPVLGKLLDIGVPTIQLRSLGAPLRRS